MFKKILQSSFLRSSSLQTSMMVAVAGGSFMLFNKNNETAGCYEGEKKHWRTITRAEVAQHKTPEQRMWVTWKNGVFDITNFLGQHPGGPLALKQAAGGPLEPFWSMYRLHYSDKIQGHTLHLYKIGELPKEEILDFDDNFIPEMRQNIPTRTVSTLLTQVFPYTCESNPTIIERYFITPLREGYVRSHNAVPIIDVDAWKVDVHYKGKLIKQVTMEDLKALPQHEVMVCVRCAGMRRTDLDDMMPHQIRGVMFGPFAIYNTVYSGPRVTDVLKFCGVNLEEIKDKHLITTGLDEDFKGDPIRTSVVMSRHLDPSYETILAIQANGDDLPEDHGYPCRILYPGFIGLRSTKWLGKMEIADEESDSRYQKKMYKLYKDKNWNDVDPTKLPPPMDHVINCVFTTPLKGQVLKCSTKNPYVSLKGIAVGSGKEGARIVKVVVSTDGGMTWEAAKITKRENKDPKARCFSWVHWEHEVKVENPGKDHKPLTVICKAFDDKGNNMNRPKEEVFNLSGVMVNPPHEIPCFYSVHYDEWLEEQEKAQKQTMK